jgi:hypothetical protein
MQTTSLGAMLANYAGQEFDRAAARLVEENGALRDLCGQAAPVVGDSELRKALESAAASGPDDDLRIPALQRTNDWLRGLLVRLHEHVETLDGEGARALEESIWAELIESTRRRHFQTGV